MLGPAFFQAKCSSCNAEQQEGNTGRAGLFFIELAGSGMSGIKPELKSLVLQSCLDVSTELLSIFSAVKGLAVPHS